MTIEWFERVWNHDDQNHIQRRMAPNVTFQLPEINGDGIDAFIEFQTMLRDIFDGIWIDVIEVIENGSEVEGTGNLTGIHRETRKPVDIDFNILFKWKDEKIVECHSVLDVGRLMGQARMD